MKMQVSLVALLAAGALVVGGCGDAPPPPIPLAPAALPAPLPPVAPPAVVVPPRAPSVASPPATTTTSARPTTTTTTSARPTTTTKKPVVVDRCTNQIDYSEDSRSNAEINSIGAKTGKCPKVQRSTSEGRGYADPCDRPGTCGEGGEGGEGEPDASGSGSSKTSGEEQYEYGCQQGSITEGC